MRLSVIVAIGLLSFPFAGVTAQGVNDAQIASIVVTANQVDIDAENLARSRPTNAEVKALAELMITDHTGVNKSTADLVAKLTVTPQDNPTSQSLKSGGGQSLAHLMTLKGVASDKAYVDHEVAYHQQVIEALDKTLIPVAPGDTIVWINKDLVHHTATSTAGSLDSKDIQADKSWKFTIRTTGDLAYICTFHPTMKAMLRIKS